MMKFLRLFCVLMILAQVFQVAAIDHPKHIEVTLRQIGHELLLASGDSHSLVLPIMRNSDEYTIQFESELEFETDTLVSLVKRSMENANINQAYVVEVQECDSGKVVYSFEMGKLTQEEIIPCRGRENAKACYTIGVTFLPYSSAKEETIDEPEKEHSNLAFGLWASIVLAFGLGASRLLRKPEDGDTTQEDCKIGNFIFDANNMYLQYEEERIELTSKEAELLDLLNQSANQTVEREVILNRVWQDEGAYIGRTLDVFISKLRKKLELDTNVKIVNIRGVGYKLIVNS